MYRSTYCYDFIRVYALWRFLAEVVFNECLHSRNTAWATNKYYFVYVRSWQLGIAYCVLAWNKTCLYKVVCKLFELWTCKSLNKMFRHSTFSCDIWQIYFCWRRAWKFYLCFFSSLFKALHCHWVFCKINTFVGFKAIYEPVNNHLVEVITAKVSVTISRKDFKNASTEFKNRDIKSTSTKVKYGNFHIFISFVNSIRQCGSSWLVDNTANIKSGNLSCFFCCLSLRVWEVSRHRYNSICNFLSKVVFCCFFHLLKYHCRYFLRCVFASFNFHTWIATFIYHRKRYSCCFFCTLLICFTHETLYWVHGIAWISDSLTLCRITHFSFSVFHEANNRRCSTFSLAVSNYHRFISFKYRNTRVCCS